MLLELIAIVSACVNISVGCLVFYIYFNLKKIINLIKMNAEELLGMSLAEQQDAAPSVQVQVHKHNKNEKDFQLLLLEVEVANT